MRRRLIHSLPFARSVLVGFTVLVACGFAARRSSRWRKVAPMIFVSIGTGLLFEGICFFVLMR